MAKKPILFRDKFEVVYDSARWDLLHSFRAKALKVMEALKAHGLNSIVHGSVARGDVSVKSDVDVVVPYVVPSFEVESSLLDAGFQIIERLIVEATPLHVIKAHVLLDNEVTVTFPLVQLRSLEREFYKFGGEVDLPTLLKNLRVPGVNKSLILILPSKRGHFEQSILGIESQVSKLLGVSLAIIEERKRVLLRRDEIGRTGVFLKVKLAPGDSFENVLRKIADRNPAVRRTLNERQ